ncbi:MAG: acetyl-CoA C-acyltransferase [Armatimonadetes bacterium]|nr:acetyl-CoA C-acyltransferase [Armatimonadota bacterium]
MARRTKEKNRAAEDRVVVVDGVRTPFVRAYTDFKDLTAVDLAKVAVRELLERVEIDPEQIDEVIMGCVLPSVHSPNVAREVVLGLGLPHRIPGYTLARACASSAQALISAVEGIYAGEYQVVLVGGTESMSNVPVPYKKSVVDTLQALSRARSFPARMKALSGFNLEDLVPSPPDIAEPATGKTMGQHAEMMARKNGISRQAQDEFALRSHQNAAAARQTGKTAEEVCTVWAQPRFEPVDEDNFVRADTTLEKLSSLKPSFDRRYGTLTAGNSSGLTDGAAALLVMSESKAAELGYKPLVAVKSWSSVSIDPSEQLLLGPAYAIPEALEKAGLALADMDLVDLHEAFAAQVLSVLSKLESVDFAKKELGRDMPVGSIPPEKVNVNGGSIALGHPFGATGARMTLMTARELERRKARYGCISICAAGGMGTAIILERLEAEK